MDKQTEYPPLPDFLATALALDHMPGLNRYGKTPPPLVGRRVMRSRPAQTIAQPLVGVGSKGE